ncbi:Ppx/GppA phosphatase family protein [Fulvivirga sediminis]|uniref:Exopolyphosphatase n=1 Tax=Fulvivirga sediminis TaxID=2803949 RepID=A0A937F941_9BACT|nr:exopolyphosphatase [Fulvivirga sediminis]MBL3656554.1 exopolyphosphatase [Fulvivirga sediminis]
MNKVAIIDCGTNTFHLLIAELSNGSFNILYSIKTPVRIGKGGISNGMIMDDAVLRATKVLKSFSETIQKYEVTDIRAFATSAFRNAKNGEEIKLQIKEVTGIDIQIISGDEEASLIFSGVKAAVKLGSAPCLIMDIGGGSIEFIIGTEKEMLWKRSFEVGAQRLLDQFHKNDPITEEEISDLESYLDKQLAPLLEAIETHTPTTLVGSSGTFDTLSEIYCRSKNIAFAETSSELPLTLQAYENIHKELLIKNRDERMNIPGMIEMRVDMIVVASCVINWLLRKSVFNKLKVSTYSLKEGALYELS